MSDKESKLYGILQKFYETDKLNELWNCHRNDYLTGTIWTMSGNKLTWLLLEVEKEFNIRVNAEDLVAGKFLTIDSILSLLG